MQRAQRGLDNPALDTAITTANLLNKPIVVFFGLHPGYPNANLRHYTFLAEGIDETRKAVENRGAGFVFRPYPDHNLIAFCDEVGAALVIGDENPLREAEGWRRSAARKLRVPFWTVDADVIVPTGLFEKEEYAARTIRPKIHKRLPEFLKPLENPVAKFKWKRHDLRKSQTSDAISILERFPLDRKTQPVKTSVGGTSAGLGLLKRFIRERLAVYDTARNLPHLPGTSGLSPYLHFGHLGPHTIALAVSEADAPQTAKDAFLEELIVRRELAINYVARNEKYDSLEGCHAWAIKSLSEHAHDPRPYLYSESSLENAETHDNLWNAAQKEMVITGRMHGYLRMYWAKKILEWTPSPAEAFEIAVRLNDRYQLDGRDPNGYTGVAWAIGAKHDRPWAPARPVFGMIRYMTASGCARKFDVNAYIGKVAELAGE
jgi:deoxyribodipyrimidine photo-lyase